jgi:hypothetical protein
LRRIFLLSASRMIRRDVERSQVKLKNARGRLRRPGEAQKRPKSHRG